jgi:hypothetical protein
VSIASDDPYAEPPVFALKTGGFAFLDKVVDPASRDDDKSVMSAFPLLSASPPRPLADGIPRRTAFRQAGGPGGRARRRDPQPCPTVFA